MITNYNGEDVRFDISTTLNFTISDLYKISEDGIYMPLDGILEFFIYGYEEDFSFKFHIENACNRLFASSLDGADPNPINLYLKSSSGPGENNIFEEAFEQSGQETFEFGEVGVRFVEKTLTDETDSFFGRTSTIVKGDLVKIKKNIAIASRHYEVHNNELLPFNRIAKPHTKCGDAW